MRKEKVKPLYANAFFKLCKKEITYFLVFDYLDKAYYYKRIVSDREKLEEEIEKLQLNMQNFLNEEKVVVNSKRCRPVVRFVDIGFREYYKRPFIMFIISFETNIRKGHNFYENEYEPELAEYDYKAYWYFPLKSRITFVDMKEEYKVFNDRILVIYGKKGTKTSGYEFISFEILS